ncbi:MAG: TetR/AcrR family transcriptional regulator [Alphaproteobacteria bacterium]|jgi:AcrR family transcriptional regulator|nr:TetR/AcrR family transcriptional regulator [Alphaproteobacteria bacterium]
MTNNNIKTKDKIIQIAKKLFAEKGFHGTSVKDICELADANISAVNYHFTSKLNLFQEIIDNVSEKCLANILSVIEDPADDFEEFKIKMKILFETFFKIAEKDWDSLVVIFSNIYFLREELQKDTCEFFDKFIHILGNFIKEGQKRKYIRNDVDPEVISKIILHIPQGEIEDRYLIYGEKPEQFNKAYQKKYINNILITLIAGLENK